MRSFGRQFEHSEHSQHTAAGQQGGVEQWASARV